MRWLRLKLLGDREAWIEAGSVIAVRDADMESRGSVVYLVGGQAIEATDTMRDVLRFMEAEVDEQV